MSLFCSQLWWIAEDKKTSSHSLMKPHVGMDTLIRSLTSPKADEVKGGETAEEASTNFSQTQVASTLNEEIHFSS